ncbi:FAD/NAD(P)-binding protein [Clostridium algoriphilum]|uniref:FAD/NAD(P)-binding protein n=1 Tax=Clostridium algoriphilum TaxID=198347 RepID=UPI001CF32946|nr:FAD/NAD(P)-binding protein [Clostridium algoriphilum]MCB2293370.1 FAD/NAD(P)-binding protein [Clostridium algoriphilum]
MSCSCNEEHVNPLIPEIVVIAEMRADTQDVTTFRVTKPGGGKPFEHMPGQCAMISVPPLGEAIFSITSSPTQKDFIEFSVKRCGEVTEYLHSLEVGSEIGVRGPYGNNFPVDDVLKGKDLLFIGGGIGLAPIRSVINYVMDNRENYGKVDILYGSRTPGDLVQSEDIFENWPSRPDTKVHLTVDHETEGWDGHVGFVPNYIKEIGFSTDKVALICGPPIMIKYSLQTLLEIGFKKEQIYTTLELKMKCGVGKCGRCNIGDKYVCKDGPVFRCDEIDELPDEY